MLNVHTHVNNNNTLYLNLEDCEYLIYFPTYERFGDIKESHIFNIEELQYLKCLCKLTF